MSVRHLWDKAISIATNLYVKTRVKKTELFSSQEENQYFSQDFVTLNQFLKRSDQI